LGNYVKARSQVQSAFIRVNLRRIKPALLSRLYFVFPMANARRISPMRPSHLLAALAISTACQPTAAVQPQAGRAKIQPRRSAAAEGPIAHSVTARENRLAKETSPYLLLHAHNPVDWYPWGPEALAKAREEKKLIFLSIGYSSCYWCHVMERESFMDPEVADLLNKRFICIKVDREERPDIDEIYMTSLQVYYQLAGTPSAGGWPLSMFLTPDARPLAGGTYFPPRDTDGRPGFLTVLNKVQDFWQQNPERAAESSAQLADIVKQSLRQRPAVLVDAVSPQALDDLQAALAEEFDPLHGGFGYSEATAQRPKFPEPANLLFLLDRARRTEDSKARAMLELTLERIARGGIRDHLGGGIHRYSTDRYWHVPHFEKMLYDNGQLATVYAEGYQLTGRPEFKQVAEELITFVLRELTSPAGGFYSALDAETDGEEGRYYVWDRTELRRLLSPAEYELLAEVYGLNAEPNFEHGRHVLLLLQPVTTVAERRQISPAELERQLAPLRAKLLAARDERKRPLTDTKIITGWNALMIRGLADAGRILKRDDYVTAAARAADFVLAKLRRPDGRLLRTYAEKTGEAKLNAYLEDYALLVEGLIALHLASGERRWLETADALTATQIELFWDQEAGGFYFTSGDHEELIARSKAPADSAIPSGNSVSVSNLTYLAKALNKPEYLDRAEQTLRALSGLMSRSPTSMPRMAMSLAAVLEARGRPVE